MKSNNNFKYKKYYLEESDNDDNLEVNNLKINKYESTKYTLKFKQKTFLEESSEDDYDKIQIPVKTLSFQLNNNKKLFVPKPKPLEIKFIPSKLKLCSIKSLNKKNCYSCPNTEDSSSFVLSSNEDGLKDLRKKLQIIKTSLPKTFTNVILINNHCFLSDYDDIYCKKEYDLYSGSDNEYEINQFRNNSPSILEILKDKI